MHILSVNGRSGKHFPAATDPIYDFDSADSYETEKEMKADPSAMTTRVLEASAGCELNSVACSVLIPKLVNERDRSLVSRYETSHDRRHTDRRDRAQHSYSTIDPQRGASARGTRVFDARRARGARHRAVGQNVHVWRSDGGFSAAQQQQRLHGLERGEFLADAVIAVVAADVPFLAAGGAVLPARAGLRDGFGGAPQEGRDAIGDVGRHDAGFGHPARQIRFEGVLVVVAGAVEFAGGGEHGPLRGRQQSCGAICPQLRAVGVVVHHRRTVQQDTCVVGPHRVIYPCAIDRVVRAVEDVEFAVDQPDGTHPIPGLLRPVHVRLVPREASQPRRDLEESAVTDAIFVMKTLSGLEHLPRQAAGTGGRVPARPLGVEHGVREVEPKRRGVFGRDGEPVLHRRQSSDCPESLIIVAERGEVGRWHVVVVRTDLRKEGLGDRRVVGGVVGVGPIIDHATPDGTSFPPVQWRGKSTNFGRSGAGLIVLNIMNSISCLTGFVDIEVESRNEAKTCSYSSRCGEDSHRHGAGAPVANSLPRYLEFPCKHDTNKRAIQSYFQGPTTKHCCTSKQVCDVALFGMGLDRKRSGTKCCDWKAIHAKILRSASTHTARSSRVMATFRIVRWRHERDRVRGWA
nr:hypothetical protein CFP56_37196 [Quercus suber]